MRRVSLFFLTFGIALCFSCNHKAKPDFKDWYANLNEKSSATETEQVSFLSSPLLIDTIYRSMQGPYEIKRIKIEEKESQLLWIVGYQSNIIDVETNTTTEDKYMCHNNLNYSDTANFPWNLKTSGSRSRIFTLSEGQTSLDFPEGFGIPVLANQRFEMVSQVLNHSDPNIHKTVQHRTTLKYKKGIQRLSPLYQQSVFVTKQIAGPAGDYGTPKKCLHLHLDSSSIKGEQPNHNCSVEISREGYDPLKDEYGRMYTGHWKLPLGYEELKTDVTKMLDLSDSTRIHMIGVHLHPFAVGLRLRDKTQDTTLYTAKISKTSGSIGFSNIDYFKSPQGIALFPGHQYELISEYNCTDSLESHTAMAVMYLYLAE